jgi:hypothetical protein
MKVPPRVKSWLYLAFISTALVGLVYLTQQQQYRLEANDPQIQLAQDAAAKLKSGTSPQALVGTTKVDLSTSLAPYLMVFDQRHNLLAAGAGLHDAVVTPPDGTFDAALQHGEHRFTWQPRPGVRQAVVLVSAPGAGYVLAGRSLYEVELREYQLLVVCSLALAVMLAAAAALVRLLK